MNKLEQPSWREDVSKTIENAIRFASFKKYYLEGFDAASDLCDKLCAKECVTKLIDNSAALIARGVKGELNFFNRYGLELNLTPTLDAGCAYDFVGDCEHIIKGSRFLCIDVTTNSDVKRTNAYMKEINYGWPLVYAEVTMDSPSVKMYDDGFNEINCDKVLNAQKQSERQIQPCQIYSVKDAWYRRKYLEMIELGYTLKESIDLLLMDEDVSPEQKKMIETHLKFFKVYRFAFHLVPGLSCGDMADFIGEHEGRLVRFRVLPDIKDSSLGQFLAVQAALKTHAYRFVSYDGKTDLFTFHSNSDYRLLNDEEEVLRVFDDEVMRG